LSGPGMMISSSLSSIAVTMRTNAPKH
jgi:hypothetical protein